MIHTLITATLGAGLLVTMYIIWELARTLMLRDERIDALVHASALGGEEAALHRRRADELSNEVALQQALIAQLVAEKQVLKQRNEFLEGTLRRYITGLPKAEKRSGFAARRRACPN